MKRKKVSQGRRKRTAKHNDTVSHREIALITNTQTFYVFTPNIKKSSEELDRIRQVYDNRYKKPSRQELNDYPPLK